MGEGADHDPVVVDIEGVGPLLDPVQVGVVDVQYLIFEPVDGRMVIGVGRRHVQVAGDPKNNLRILVEDLPDRFVRLGDFLIGIGFLEVVAQSTFERRVVEDDGGNLWVGGQLGPEPGQLPR